MGASTWCGGQEECTQAGLGEALLYLSFGVWYLYRSGKSGGPRMGSDGINNGCEEKVKNVQRGERGERDKELGEIL